MQAGDKQKSYENYLVLCSLSAASLSPPPVPQNNLLWIMVVHHDKHCSSSGDIVGIYGCCKAGFYNSGNSAFKSALSVVLPHKNEVSFPFHWGLKGTYFLSYWLLSGEWSKCQMFQLSSNCIHCYFHPDMKTQEEEEGSHCTSSNQRPTATDTYWVTDAYGLTFFFLELQLDL